MSNEHGARTEQEVNILIAAGVAYPALLAFGDYDVSADVAKAAAGQYVVRPLNQFGFRLGYLALCHLAAPFSSY